MKSRILGSRMNSPRGVLFVSMSLTLVLLTACGGGSDGPVAVPAPIAGIPAPAPAPAPVLTPSPTPTPAPVITTINLNDQKAVEKLAARAGGYDNFIDLGSTLSVSSTFTTATQTRSGTCTGGGTNKLSINNPDGKPSIGDSYVVTTNACANGTRGKDFSATSASTIVTLSNLSNTYSPTSIDTWTATVDWSIPNAINEFDELDALGNRNVGTTSNTLNFSIIETFEGKGTAIASDDTRTLVTSATLSGSTVKNGVNEAGDGRFNSTCVLQIASGTSTCSVIGSVQSGTIASYGSYNSSSMNVGPLVVTKTGFATGTMILTVANQAIKIEFIGTEAAPFVRITSPNGTVTTLTRAEFDSLA